MTGKQSTVLWIGLILVAFNLVRKWKDIASVIFAGATSATPPGASTSDSGRQTVTIPVDPFLPTGPKITIPLPF